ncbi:MAG: hypothetical protein GX270_15810 [Clostridiaceae bacterium]|jgi:hypothetical protein|nr:hypothetical protein [Clostridiaceae bacterium]
MFKRFLSGLILVVLLISGVPALAAQGQNDAYITSNSAKDKVIFERTFTVTEEGGSFEVGFVTAEFKKNFLPAEQYPKTFTLRVCARDGEVGIEAYPDTDNFLKPVLIRVNKYNGYLYDEVLDENIFVSVKNKTIPAKHFSWYRFR